VATQSRCSTKPAPADAALYQRVKAAAKRKFPVYPSIYANSWLVAEYKRRGGKYACSPERTRGGLRKWYREKWVDLSRPLPGGGYEPCGREHVDRGSWRSSYPKCRPLSVALALTPAQVRSAVKRKRAAVRHSKPGKPTYVRTLAANPLERGCSPAARSANIRELIHTGRPVKQAVAIAYAEQRRQGCHTPRRKRKRSSGKLTPNFIGLPLLVLLVPGGLVAWALWRSLAKK